MNSIKGFVIVCGDDDDGGGLLYYCGRGWPGRRPVLLPAASLALVYRSRKVAGAVAGRLRLEGVPSDVVAVVAPAAFGDRFRGRMA